jgi:hypothetical protein
MPNGCKIDHMTIKYTNIAKSPKTYPNWDFWFEKVTPGNPDSHA